MKKMSRKLVMMIILTTMVFAVAISIGVYAIISSTSTRGNIEVTTDEINATTSYSSSTSSFDYTYEASGDAKTININTLNQSEVVLHNRYNVEATGDKELLDAILVYFNNEYISTLAELTEVTRDIEDEYSFIQKAQALTDSFKFELHQSAKLSLYDNKNITFKITTISENADYLDYIYVTDEETFKRAIDDINSGLFEVLPTVILCNSVPLENEYTITNPLNLYLKDGAILSGDLVLDDDNTTEPNAVIKLLGNGTFNANVDLGVYDEDTALDIYVENIKDIIGESINAGSETDIIKYYSFYPFNVTVLSNCQFTSPNLIAGATTNEYYSKVASIEVEDQVIEFKVVGSKTELINETLAHLPNDGKNINTDLFLPTYIKDQNATITWKSSNTDVISNEGRISATRLENEAVSLLATIKVNDTVVTREFNFTVSVHNNEINFYKLVQEISPIVIANVYNGPEDSDDALYYLPIVSQNPDGTFNTYDYRTSYESPVNTKLFNWLAYKDIGLKNLTYSMTDEQKAAYDYITQTGNNLYLNTETLNSFARINVTGDFGNDETYTTYINISISVGSNTQLLEKAFIQVSNELQEISVLGNIIATRISDGMGEEKGDFSLSATYKEDPEYTIEFSGANTIIDSITYDSVNDKYDFTINPEYFNEYETTVAFKATVYYKKGTIAETSKSRTFYVVVPAALHVDDFGTISLYESAKYQVFSQLPSNEKTGNTGYSTSSSDTILSDSNINYVLLRDIVGDANYLTEYDTNDGYYLKVCKYTQASQYAQGVSILKFMTRSTNEQQTSDTAAYDLARLIEWATSDTRVAASTVVSNTQALGSLSSTKSNAEDYLNEDELAVIKQVYKYYTGASDSDWNNVYLESFNEAPGYIYTNPELLNQVIVSVSKSLNTYYNGNDATNFATIFGKYMEVIQRYAVSTTTVNKDDAAPCQEIYNTRYRWVESTSQLSKYTYNGTSYTINYSVQLNNGKWWCRYSFAGGSSGGDGGGDAINYSLLASDRTSYITEDELTVLRVFWLNGISAGSASTTGLNTSLTSNYSNVNKVLQDDGGIYYSGFSLSNFNTAGKALLNAFDACLEIPTYFTADGVSLLIKEFYNNYNYGSKKYELNKYGENTKTFNTSLNSGIPYVTNVDSLKSALSYFTNLSTLEIYGNDNLAAFLSENGLSTVVARTSLVNKEISRLVMQNVAHTNTNFDLTNIKNYDKLTYLDLSNNLGIHSVNELVNVNRGNYTYVNITNIGVEYEYQEFAIDNIATSTCTIYYKNANGVNTYSNDSSRASDLADLSDFNKFISKYMYMTNVIYNEDGTTTTINWRIDEGNELYGTITNPGKYPSFSTVEEMNKFISPYYYCTEDFTYTYGDNNQYSYGFTAGDYYKMYYSNGRLQFQNLGSAPKINTIDNSLRITNDASGITQAIKTTTTSTETVTDNGTRTIEKTKICYENVSSISQNVTITFNGYKLRTSNTTTGNIYLSYDSNSNYIITNSSNNNGTIFFFLSFDEAKSIIDKSLEYNGQTLGNNTGSNLYMCFVYNNTLYFVGNNTHGTDQQYAYYVTATTDIDSACVYTVNFSNSRYTITDNTDVKYLISYDNNLLHYYTNYGTYRYYRTSNTSQNISYNGTFNPKFTLYDANGEVGEYSAYSLYCHLVKVENKITNITYLESVVSASVETGEKYYLYTGSTTTYNGVTIKQNTIIQIKDNYITPVSSRSRVDTKTETIYLIVLNYKTSANSEEYEIDVTNYSYVEWISTNDGDYEEYYFSSMNKPSNTTSTIEGTWSNWSTPLEWQFNRVNAYNYCSYVTEIDSSLISQMTLNQKYNIYSYINDNYNVIYRYTGTTGSETVYNESITGTVNGTIGTTYTNNNSYKLSISNNVLKFESNGTVYDSTGTTMDSVLAEANSHFKDYLYGSYYGRYYAYSGVGRYISSGIYVEPNTIYRIMPNSANTAFEWVKVKAYTEGTSDNILIALGTGQLSVGDIVYSNAQAGFGFFNAGWYKVTLDEKTNIVNLVKYNDMGITINGASTYTRLANDKLVQRSGDYLGYSGTFTVQITALIRTVQSDGTVLEYKKIYKMKFVGSLYEV